MDEEKDLAKEKQKQVKETEKYYKNVSLELEKIRLNNVVIEEKHIKEQDSKKDEIKDTVEYGILIKFKGEDIKIASIDKEGNLITNNEILKDEKYDDKDKKNLGDMLNLLGLEKDKVDLSKLKEQLKEMEAMTKEEYEKYKEEQEKEKVDDENTIKDKGEDQKGKDKELAEKEREGEEKVIAQRMNIDSKKVCKIRRDSQFFKNYPNVPKTAFFYLDGKDRMQAKYVDKDGSIKDLKGFSEIKERNTVVSLGNDGQNIKEERVYRVMTAKGLENQNQNIQDIRIAMYKDTYGYLRIETIQQGRNGEWEGKNIDTYGRERNTKKMNDIINERNKTPHVGAIAERHDQMKESGYSQDGIQLDELSKRRKMEEYIKDGYTPEEANKIYDYVTKEKMFEDDAKVRVCEESAEKNEKDDEKTPWGDAQGRRNH